jgi:hypothetical protein
MLPWLLLAAPAFATDVLLQVLPDGGRDAFVRFTDVVPGVMQMTELPCAKAPTCRLSVTLAPAGDEWRVSVRVEAVRPRLFGPAQITIVMEPTFTVAAERMASAFQGYQEPIGGTSPQAWQMRGLHVQAYVDTAAR